MAPGENNRSPFWALCVIKIGLIGVPAIEYVGRVSKAIFFFIIDIVIFLLELFSLSNFFFFSLFLSFFTNYMCIHEYV